MEQNQTAPAQPVNPVVQALEQTEPVQPAPTPMQSAPAPKKKSSATVLSIVLLLIIALGGIGFGVWAFMDKNEQVDKLNKQLASVRAENSELVTKVAELEEKVNNGGSSTTDETQKLDLGEWGLSISFPDTLKGLAYSLESDSVCVSGYTDKGTGAPSFAGNPKNTGVAYVCVHRGTQDDPSGSGYFIDKASFSIDGFYYWVNGPQALTTEVESEADWEVESMNAILTVLKDVNNYSKNS